MGYKVIWQLPMFQRAMRVLTLGLQELFTFLPEFLDGDLRIKTFPSKPECLPLSFNTVFLFVPNFRTLDYGLLI